MMKEKNLKEIKEEVEHVIFGNRKKVLIVVDMQYDFITGTLANKAAENIVEPICKLIKDESWDMIVLTRDTHYRDYLDSAEGKKLPVVHCITDTKGWIVHEDITNAIMSEDMSPIYIDKPTFGYAQWGDLPFENADITVVGTCTDICVISNVLILKALFPEANIRVIENLCAGLTPELHQAALAVMNSCQVDICDTKPIDK